MAFWGLVLEPKKTYTQREVEQPFHISMAALDVQSSDSNEHTTVVCRKRDQDFILCNLSKKHGVLNVPLNLDFELGAEINFHVLGNSSVHLTGYIIEDMESFEDSDESGGEEEEEADNDVVLKNTKKQLDAIKRKENAPQSKSKKAKLEVNVEEEEDEDDSDFDMDGSDDAEEEEVEEEEEDDDDEEDEEEDEEEPAAPPKDQGKKDKSKQQPKNQQANVTPKGQKQDQKQQNQQKNQPKGQTPQPNKSNGQPQANGPRKQVVQGVVVEDLQVGSGPVAKIGKAVAVYYVGRLKSNNKQFDATTTGAGFTFRLGRGEVIKGWDVGVAGMKVGGKRRLTIPPKMAYGEKGAGSAVPPNAALVFDVELKRVK